MKTPFQFPSLEYWSESLLVGKNTRNYVYEPSLQEPCSAGTKIYTEHMFDTEKTYALFYLLALRDWVALDKDLVSYPQKIWTVAYDDIGEWLTVDTQASISIFNFEYMSLAQEFLSHKFDHTSTLEQLNILYSINQ